MPRYLVRSHQVAAIDDHTGILPLGWMSHPYLKQRHLFLHLYRAVKRIRLSCEMQVAMSSMLLAPRDAGLITNEQSLRVRAHPRVENSKFTKSQEKVSSNAPFNEPHVEGLHRLVKVRICTGAPIARKRYQTSGPWILLASHVCLILGRPRFQSCIRT